MPPISSLLPCATQPLTLLPQDAVATSALLQQFSAVRQLTHNLQQRKPRHPKHPHCPQVTLVRQPEEQSTQLYI